MKNLLCLFALSLLFACGKDAELTHLDSSTSLESMELDTRNSDNWCDGGSTVPSPIQNVNVVSTDPCCIIVQLTQAYSNVARVRIGTTNYNFITQSGTPQGTFDSASVINGTFSFCFEQIGSHLLLEFYDDQGNIIACDSIENPC